ncbi:hypothetical protein SeMB42_g02665 [Synchytrium endobioticum]|nr:hypothetical protein SeMB42_g02665 [Synchytrium endobioticum]
MGTLPQIDCLSFALGYLEHGNASDTPQRGLLAPCFVLCDLHQPTRTGESQPHIQPYHQPRSSAMAPRRINRNTTPPEYAPDDMHGGAAAGGDDPDPYDIDAAYNNQALQFLNAMDALLQRIGASLGGMRLDEDAYNVLSSTLHILIESLGAWCGRTLTRFEIYCDETSQMLDNTTMLYVALLLGNLTHVTYRHPWGMSLEAFTHLSNLKLTHLNVITDYLETAVFDTMVCPKFPFLTHLGVSCFADSAHQCWHDVIRGLSKLKHLKWLQLDWSNSVNMDGLLVSQFTALLNACPLLEGVVYKVAVEAYIDEDDIELEKPYRFGVYGSWTSGESSSVAHSMTRQAVTLDKWHRKEMVKILDEIKDLFEQRKVKLTINYEIE